MLKHLAFHVFSLAYWSVAIAVTSEPPIKFPDLSVTPAPPTPPAPAPVIPAVKLDNAQLYVVTSDSPFFLLSSPDGVVKITQVSGPITIRAVFWDGNGGTETRTYSQKQVVMVEAASGGHCELLAIPSGATDPKQVVRRTLDVGQLPIPPPINPPLTDFQQKVQTAFTADGSPAQQAANLAAFYRKAAGTDSSTLVYDPGFTTGAGLLNAMHKGAQALIGDALPKTRRAIADELNVSFSKVGTLDKPTRDSLSAAFIKVATALEVVK